MIDIKKKKYETNDRKIQGGRTNKLKAELKKKRDAMAKEWTRAESYYEGLSAKGHFKGGFNAATEILLPKLEKCRAALEGIIVLESRSPDVVGKLGQTTTYIYARQTMEAEFEQGE